MYDQFDSGPNFYLKNTRPVACPVQINLCDLDFVTTWLFEETHLDKVLLVVYTTQLVAVWIRIATWIDGV